MGEPSWERTEAAVRSALDAGDLSRLVPLLAPAVRWHGAGPGGCHTREHVVAWIGGLPVGFRLLALRRVADRIAVHAVDPAGNAAHQHVVLDDDGRITAILDHPDAVSAEADLAAAPADAPAVVADALVPFVQVADVEASIAFYTLLGFGVLREHGPAGRRVWAWLRGGQAELMVAETEEPVDPAAQGVLFYLYADDLDGLRAHLRAHGQLPSGIADGSPGPRRELRIDDPDGYCLMIAEREAAT
jgi:catechol 2,3-dioxygenase-like lactoylglutathione lyase family enzyme